MEEAIEEKKKMLVMLKVKKRIIFEKMRSLCSKSQVLKVCWSQWRLKTKSAAFLKKYGSKYMKGAFYKL